jgi:hypothetical protein
MALNGRALLGFMQEQEAIAYLRNMCAYEDSTPEDLRKLWAAAQVSAAALPEVPLAAEVLDIDPAFAGHLASVASDPMMPEMVAKKKWSFQRVEIDRLVCFQKHVSTEHGENVTKGVDVADPAQVLQACLPVEKVKRNVGVGFEPRENAFTIFAPGADFRVLGTSQGEDAATKRKIFGFAVGWGVPHVQVVRFQGRYFLKNGYHRLVALRSRGLTHAPCILIEGESFDDVGARDGFFDRDLLLSKRPPLFGDFLADAVCPAVPLRPRTKVIRIKAEEIIVPAALAIPAVREAAGQVLKAAALPSNGHYLDFRVVQEDWNTYRLRDGTVLRTRQHLTRLDKAPGQAPGEFAAKLSTVIVAVLPAHDLKGPPSKRAFAPEELERSIVEREVPFERTRETASEYEVEGGNRIQLRLLLRTVSRTSLFDGDGEPIYLVNTETQFQASPPA